MSWSGYLALGSYENLAFTESTATGYGRQPFTVGPLLDGKVQGNGNPLTFTATSVVTTYNAYGFYSATSGGDPVYVHPLVRSLPYGQNTSVSVNPYNVSFSIVDGDTSEGVPIDVSKALAIAGTTPTTTGNILDLTAHGSVSSGAVTVNFASVRVHTVTLASATTVLTLSGISHAGYLLTGMIMFTQDSVGNRSVTFPANIRWQGGFSPSLSTAPGSTDCIQFLTIDDGATWIAGIGFQVPAAT